MKTSFIAMTIFLISAMTSIQAMERTETVYGAPKIVYREFTVLPQECLDKIPTVSAPRAAWKCVFVYPGSTNAFSFNPALEYKERGRVSAGSDVVIDFESHPNGGSIGFTAPSATVPGSTRMIPLEEIRQILQTMTTQSWRIFKFKGTFLVL